MNGYPRAEMQALWELADTKERSVIATGGSVLSFDHNIPILKRLGHILFIDRYPEILSAPVRSRYVMQVNDEKPANLDTLNIESHLDLPYADVADITVGNHGDENEGIANLVSAIKGLERDAQPG
jgi:shikimate kinase